MQRSHRNHAPERICAFYSKGPHFVRMLKRLRDEYPGETLIAAIPTSYPFNIIEPLIDETIRLPEQDEIAGVRRWWAVIRRLRRARCSHFVVMFDSPRLNLLARASNTGRRWCFSVDGRMHALEQSLFTLLYTPLCHRLCGEWDYRRARLGTARKAKRTD